jgi:hypothetical protein
MTMTCMQSARALALAMLAVLLTTGDSLAEDKTSGSATGFGACQEKMNVCTDRCDDNRNSRSGGDYEACLKSCSLTYVICINAAPPVAKSGTGKKGVPSAK